MSDFCQISPFDVGGRAGWANPTESEYNKLVSPRETEDCRDFGKFRQGDLYCTHNEPYVWRCLNDFDCNYLKPIRDGAD